MVAVAIVFHGPIGAPATARLRNALCHSANGGNTNGQKPDELYLLMSSGGGSLDDGLSLYGLIASLPVPVTTVNTSLVGSIAIAPFLAGKKRIAMPHSYFHFHNFSWTYTGATTETRFEIADHSQLIDAARTSTFKLLEQHTTLAAKDFESLKLLTEPVVKDAGFAKEKGVVQEIGLPALPAGTPIFNADY